VLVVLRDRLRGARDVRYEGTQQGWRQVGGEPVPVENDPWIVEHNL
jgi:hypothetical protein